MVGGLAPPAAEDELAAAQAGKGGVYFVLEDADLQVGKVGKVGREGARSVRAMRPPQAPPGVARGKQRRLQAAQALCPPRAQRPVSFRIARLQEYRLLNSDEHAMYLQRKGEDPALYRPDICQQVPRPAAVPRARVRCSPQFVPSTGG